ncbi:MAG: hypothetical protein U0M42_09610 [Acutalibacteraceae bacterium]|nr:hypothetical protein [Acutalibacteraceae bacterium]
MKMVKKFFALLLVLVMVFSFTACHKKNEIAVTIGGIEFTSAMYSYALLCADGEARTLVDENIAAQETESTASTTEEVDYYAQTIDEKSFVKWVEDRAIELLSEWAAYQKLCDENNITLDEDALSEAESYAQYYYSYYGAVYSANGIGEETYKNATLFESYSNEYFKFLYGKEGSKAIPEDDVKNAFNTSYRVVLVLQADTTEMDDTAKAEAKTKLEDAQKQLNDGKSVVEVYNEYNGLTEESAATTGYSPAKETKDCANVVADPEVDENYGVTFWSDVKDMVVGESKILETEQNGSKYICLVYYIGNDSEVSFLENMDESIRWNLKHEEYQADISTYAKDLAVKKNNYAIKAFKVKDINYGY